MAAGQILAEGKSRDALTVLHVLIVIMLASQTGAVLAQVVRRRMIVWRVAGVASLLVLQELLVMRDW